MTVLRAVTPLVATHFRIVRPLGAGGTGVVYEAIDERSHTRVALKAMPAESQEALARIHREVGALRGISHPHLLRVGELFVEQGTAYLSMELVSGSSFLEHVRPPGHTLPFDEQRLRAALSQLASGLLALHAAGRVHRDVKPENVLVTADARVVLVDFGLVSDLHAEHDEASEAVGTALYMAPEQAAGRAVGPEADWYSVGVMLYEALCGALPFTGSSLDVLIEKQRSDPEPVRAREPRAPEDLSELCAQLLRFEPKARPTGRSVLRKLSGPTPHGELGARSTHSLLASMRGRKAEFDAFDHALAELRAHRGSVLELTGEPGTGKTRLLTALCSRALESGARVMFGRVRSSAPYNALHAIIEPIAELLRREAQPAPPLLHGELLQRVFVALEDVPAQRPAGSSPDPQELRANLFSAVRGLFERLCAQHLVVVALDDFDEVDADSLALLSELFRPPEAPPCLLIVASAEVGERDDFSRRAAVRLPLSRLAPYEADDLARDLTQITGHREQAAEIASRARGLPLLVEELVRLSASGAELDDVRSVADACRLRAERLPPVARRAAEFLAQCPAPLGLEVLAQLLSVSSSEVSRLTSMLVLLGFAHAASDTRGETLALAHAAFRAPLLSRVPGEELRRRHLALASTLELSAQSTPEILAFHYSCAGADRLCATRALEAAEQAEKSLAFERAARLFTLAQRHLLERPQELRAARVRAGRALSYAGKGVLSAAAYVAAQAGSNAAEALDLGQRAAQQLMFAGEIQSGEALLRSTLALESVPYPRTPLGALLFWGLDLVRLKLRGLRFRKKDSSQLPSHVLTRIDACWQAGMMLVVSDTVRSNFFVLRSLLEALRAGQPYRVARALAVHAGVLSVGGARTEAACEKLFSEVERLVREAGSPAHGTALLLGGRGQSLFLSGRFAQALELTSKAEQLLRSECREVPWELNVVRLWGARSLQYLGENRELTTRVPRLLEECRQRGNLHGEVSILLSVHAHVLLAQDLPHDALRHVLEAQRRWPADGFHVQHYHGLISRVSIALYEGNAREAHERASEAMAGLARSLLGRIQFARIVTHAACGMSALALARASADPKALHARARGHARRLLREPAAWAVPQGEALLACLAHEQGKRDEAIALWRRAVRGFAAAKMALYAASARLNLGHLLDDSEGESLCREAEALLRDQGVARPLAFARTLVPCVEREVPAREITGIRARVRGTKH